MTANLLACIIVGAASLLLLLLNLFIPTKK